MVRHALAVLALASGCSTAWDSDEYATEHYAGTWDVTGGVRIDYTDGRPGPEQPRTALGALQFEIDTDGDGQQLVTYDATLHDLAQWRPLDAGMVDRRLPDNRGFSYYFWDEFSSRLFFANEAPASNVLLTAITLVDSSDDSMTWLYVELDAPPAAGSTRLLVREELTLERR